MSANVDPQSPPTTSPFSLPTRWACVLLFVFVIVTYLPALAGGFIWDDAGHVTRGDLRSFEGLFRIWFEPGATQQFYPVLHSAFWLEQWVFGDAPWGYHLMNALQHAGSACLFGLLLLRLRVPGAWVAAGLFALHPVCVESVAWISEQKNTLSTLFYLAAALAYLRYDEDRSPKGYFKASGFFLAALLSKTVTATLPAALLVITWWRRGKLEWRRDVLPLLPWFVLGLGGGLCTAWMEHAFIGAQGANFELGLIERFLVAGRVVWFYFWKLLWPAELIFIYPRWQIDASALWQYLFPLAALAVPLVCLWRKWRGALAVALLFGGTLTPALGFINVYPFVFSWVADHFQYLASLAIFAGAGVLASKIAERGSRAGAVLGVLVVLVSCAGLSFSQTGIYKDLTSLYESTLAKNPSCWMAYNNLGNVLVSEGRTDEAVANFERAIVLKPDFAEAHNNLGDALNRLCRPLEAIPALEKALQLQPKYAEAFNNLGVSRMRLRQPTEGIAAFEKALQHRRNYPQAHFNLGLALASNGRPAEALVHFEKAAEQDPAYAQAQLYCGLTLTMLGRPEQALVRFEKALALRPEYPEAQYAYGQALVAAGRLDAGIAQLQKSVQANPEFAEARAELVRALRRAGREAEARLYQ